VRDQIEADLMRHLDRVDGALLAAVLRQIGLAHDLVAAISRHLAALRAGQAADGRLLTQRCGAIEQKADRIAFESRNEVDRLNARPLIGQLIDRAEEAVDELEQAAFIASLMPEKTDRSLLTSLAELARWQRPRPKSPRAASPPRSTCRRDGMPIRRTRSPL
jgi:hypothetical protein